MAKRKRRKSYTKKRSRSRKRSMIAQVKSMARPFASGIGGFVLGTTALNYLPMQIPQPVRDFLPYGASFLLGGWQGAVGAFLLTGGLAKVGGITGGTSGFIMVK